MIDVYLPEIEPEVKAPRYSCTQSNDARSDAIADTMIELSLDARKAVAFGEQQILTAAKARPKGSMGLGDSSALELYVMLLAFLFKKNVI